MQRLTKQGFKADLYEQLARIGKALSSGRRLELLELLTQGGRTVEGLALETGMSIANTSQHLQVLRSAHLVIANREGTYVRYRVSNDKVLGLWLDVRKVGAAQLAEVQQTVDCFFEERGRLKATTCEELLDQLEAGSVTVLDVRPEQEFHAGHIRGARSIPVEDLEARLKEIPKRQTIVAYCRGPYCVLADDVVKALHERGFRASRLTEGFPDWKLRGFPIETSLKA